MTASIDLDRYFARIGWGDPATPTFDTLAGLIEAHTATIPFENLDVLLNRPIRLDPRGLQAKLITNRRGGYCFEHATLLAGVLEAIGFNVTRHTARVVLFMPRSASPRGHMLLIVRLAEGEFVVDPGFAAFACRRPLPLVDGGRVASETMVHTMVREGRYWVLNVEREGASMEGWVTTLDADNAIDFEVGNHYMSTHPEAVMRNHLLLNALTRDGRVSVMNQEVTIRRGSGVQKSVLADRRALRTLIEENFGFDLPEIEAIKVPSIPDWT